MTVKLLDNLRKDIKAKIDIADESLLKEINAILFSKKNNDDVVAFTMKGKSVTRKELEHELLHAEKEIKAGNFFTIDELESKFK